MVLGPLTNPAKAQHVVIGVFDDKLVDLMANTLMEIGSVDHGVVIHGCGLDEISPLGPSTIVEIKATRSETAEKVYTSKRYVHVVIRVQIACFHCCSFRLYSNLI